MADADESPLAACRREIREEIGLDLPASRLPAIVDGAVSQDAWR
ncbi:NUDIX domain-containing protein [Micromonospora sp. NPDC049460]